MLRVDAAFSRRDAVQVTAGLFMEEPPGQTSPEPPPPGAPPAAPAAGAPATAAPAGGPGTAPTAKVDPAVVLAVVRAASGTAHAAILYEGQARAAGIAQELEISGYVGDASWVGYPIVSGRWYANPGEVVVSSYFLNHTGRQVGDRLTFDSGQVATIVGEVLAGTGNLIVIGDATLLKEPLHVVIEIGLAPGTDAAGYAAALGKQFGEESGVYVEDRSSDYDAEAFIILETLIATLTLLLCAVAALGVLNTVVLTTRERTQEIGVLKALGMTPRQTRTMVITSMVGLGLVAGVVAVPLGVRLHHWIVPLMGEGAGTPLPASVIDVYGLPQLVLLGCAGIALAVVGALLPAGWAARTRVATALRAE